MENTIVLLELGGGGIVVSGGTPASGPGLQGAALSCFNCSLNLTGHRYILRDEKPFCIRCYETLFANQCEECKRPIGTDHKVSIQPLWLIRNRLKVNQQSKLAILFLFYLVGNVIK